MTHIDQNLRASLSADDEQFLAELEKEGFFGQLFSTFRGPTAFVSYVAISFIIIFTIAMIYAGWMALHAQTEREIILWSAGFIALLIPQGLMRLWLFNRANHLAVLRELKIIQLRLARLGEDSTI